MIDRTIPPTTHPLPELSCPEAEITRLPNGIRFMTYSGGVQPVSTLSIIFQGGIEAGDELLTKFTVSQITEGTRRHTGDEIAEMIDFYGIKLTPRFFEHHSELDIDFINDTAVPVMELLTEILTEPVFPEERLKTAVMRAITAYRTARNQMPNLAAEEMQRCLFGPHHPSGNVPDESTLLSITPERCRECFDKLMQPATMTVALAGLLDQKVIDTVTETLSKLKGTGNGYAIENYPVETVKTPCVRNLGHSESYQAAVMLGIPAILRSHPDYNDLRLTVMALGGYFGSRLMKNIREDKGLTYGISATLNGLPDFSYIEIAATCDRSYVDTVLNEIQAEIKSLVSNPPQNDELHRLKLHAESSLASYLDTPASIMSYNLFPIVLNTPQGYFSAQQTSIRNLTPERISEIAAKYLSPEHTITIIA